MNFYARLAARFPSRALEQPALAGLAQNGGAPCIETGDGRRITYGDLDAATARMARLLVELGAGPGARVVAHVDKSPEALFLYLATLRAGCAFVPLNVAYQAAELSHFLDDAAPAIVVCALRNEAWLAPLAERVGARVLTLEADGAGSLTDGAASSSADFPTVGRAASDLAAIVYTSGTTGRSKGAMLTHGNLAANAEVLHAAWRWRPGDVLLHALPIFHVHGLFVACHGALWNGGAMLWLPRLDVDELLRLLPRATVMMGVPTHYARLLADPRLDRARCAGVRLFISGSAPLSVETFEEFRGRTGHAILERYGMSETLMITSNPCDGERVAGTVGRALPGTAVRVVDERGAPCPAGAIGGIEVRGPSVFGGYWRMPEKTREEFTADGWFKTGDVGRLGGAGLSDDVLTIVGRAKDVIITGGFNVYPKEVEGFLDQLDGVLESAVVGVPDAEFGERVVAAVVPRGGAALDEAALIAALRTRIAHFKVPRRIALVAELPRNAMGKVQKNLLRERLRREPERE